MTRFYEAPPWRFIVTTLISETLTFLDHLAVNRTVTFVRNAPLVISGEVPADNPEVNLSVPAPDGDPFLTEGTRLIYGFRRDGPPEAPWVCRAAGTVLEVQDITDSTSPRSRYTAYDPWQVLYRRPVITDELGTLPPSIGETYEATRGSDIILDQLHRTWIASGPPPLDFGESLEFGGTIEDTPVIDEINFARGSSIGELFDALVETGTLDIRIDPVYDPVNRPGITGELNIFSTAGAYKADAVFAWDLWPRNVVGLTRLIDGTKRFNRVTYYAGQGGVPAVEQLDLDSIERYGEYFEQKFWPGQTKTAAVQAMAVRALVLMSMGEVAYTLEPASERAPIPLTEYRIHDTVPIYASSRFRDAIADEDLRVEGIPIVIGDDMLERVNGLLVSRESILLGED